MRLRLSAGGARLRFRLSNEYGDVPLVIGGMRTALLRREDRVGSTLPVTFSQATSARIGAGKALLSDPVELPTGPRAQLEVRLYVVGPLEPCSCHADAGSIALLSPPGDYTEREFEPAQELSVRPFLSAVHVAGGSNGPVVVALGDSITDGYLSTAGADRRWPDRLAERLAVSRRHRGTAVVNAGISGNRLLRNGILPIFGESALRRFDRDVLAIPSATHVVILEGINDILYDPGIDAAKLISGYCELAARGRAAGLSVILATIVPFAGNEEFTASGEATRTSVNDWIRRQQEADAIVDFDLALRDPKCPPRIHPALHAGDWLHPNDDGYRRMGDAVPLGLFG